MKLYAWILGLSLIMLSVNAFAAPQDGACRDVAMALASDVGGGQPTRATLSHVIDIDKDTADYVYVIEVVGGLGSDVQNVAATVRVFIKDGVAYCG